MKLIRLTGILALLALAACDADIEPIDQRIRTLDAWNAAEWAAYAEGLRAYKAGDHYVTYACFDNAPERIESEKNCIRSLPDSLDAVILRNPLSDFDREDISELHKRSTRVLATAECSDPATALQRLDATLQEIASSDLDGIVIRYSGAVTAEASAVEPEVAQRLGALSGKTVVFEGNAAFVGASSRGLYDLYLLDTTTASDIFTVENALDYLTGYYGIEADRVLPLVSLTGTIADERGTSQPAPTKVSETIQSRRLAGMAFDGVSNDYYSLTGNYSRLRAAIDLLNPAHQ